MSNEPITDGGLFIGGWNGYDENHGVCELHEKCRNGHEYTEENTRWILGQGVNPRRRCRTCEKAWNEARKAKRKIVVSPPPFGPF